MIFSADSDDSIGSPRRICGTRRLRGPLSSRWPRGGRVHPGLRADREALLLAALGGTIAVGAWLNREVPIPEVVTYENGVIMATGAVASSSLSIRRRSRSARSAASTECDLITRRCDRRGRPTAAASPTSRRRRPISGWLTKPASGYTRRPLGKRDRSTECSDVYCELEWTSRRTDPGRIHHVPGLRRNPRPGRPRGRFGRDPAHRPRDGPHCAAAFSPDGTHIALPMIGGGRGCTSSTSAGSRMAPSAARPAVTGSSGR